tara:strand:+ start:1347 stop:1649 length:303 start_codon:yes stop_codon:yes gene_type:complete
MKKLMKMGQLAGIEIKFFLMGLLVGLIGGLTLVYLGTKKILPFKIPLVCGSALFLNKKGQLGVIEGKYFFVGFFVGIILALVLVFLGTAKILPFKIPLVC